jgi:hypothetical protein
MNVCQIETYSEADDVKSNESGEADFMRHTVEAHDLRCEKKICALKLGVGARNLKRQGEPL